MIGKNHSTWGKRPSQSHSVDCKSQMNLLGFELGSEQWGASDWLSQPWPGSTAVYLKVFLHRNDNCVYILPFCPTW